MKEETRVNRGMVHALPPGTPHKMGLEDGLDLDGNLPNQKLLPPPADLPNPRKKATFTAKSVFSRGLVVALLPSWWQCSPVPISSLHCLFEDIHLPLKSQKQNTRQGLLGYRKPQPFPCILYKSRHPNVKVAMSLGDDTINDENICLSLKTINSWVRNAIHSITEIPRKYNLDGIDIDQEYFHADPDTFAECIVRLLLFLKQKGVVSFASIAFRTTALPGLLKESSNYRSGKVLVSFGTDGSRGLSPENGFLEASRRLKRQGKLHAIFVWSADDSKKLRAIEIHSQNMLLMPLLFQF
ncbi:hypothetical protein CRYUN_Cryun25bG0112800 [Craigia yunnanensis]